MATDVETTAECPECGATVTFKGKVEKGELVACPDCAADLEVVKINPVVLELAPDEEEDWGE